MRDNNLNNYFITANEIASTSLTNNNLNTVNLNNTLGNSNINYNGMEMVSTTTELAQTNENNSANTIINNNNISSLLPPPRIEARIANINSQRIDQLLTSIPITSPPTGNNNSNNYVAERENIPLHRSRTRGPYVVTGTIEDPNTWIARNRAPPVGGVAKMKKVPKQRTEEELRQINENNDAYMQPDCTNWHRLDLSRDLLFTWVSTTTTSTTHTVNVSTSSSSMPPPDTIINNTTIDPLLQIPPSDHHTPNRQALLRDIVQSTNILDNRHPATPLSDLIMRGSQHSRYSQTLSTLPQGHRNNSTPCVRWMSEFVRVIENRLVQAEGVIHDHILHRGAGMPRLGWSHAYRTIETTDIPRALTELLRTRPQGWAVKRFTVRAMFDPLDAQTGFEAFLRMGRPHSLSDIALVILPRHNLIVQATELRIQ
jgi:hypothetical protein